jgi:hypothetical protein
MNEFPQQESGAAGAGMGGPAFDHHFDMRDALNPRRMTMAMWDATFLQRHTPDSAFADFDVALDQAVERGYNVVRLDPMPQFLDLADADRTIAFPDPRPREPFRPWFFDRPVSGPMVRWLDEFMAKLKQRPLHYALSSWWRFDATDETRVIAKPHTHVEAADLWIRFLEQWADRFGFNRLVYVDIHNEVPYFLPDFRERIKRETGSDWSGASFSPALIDFLASDINEAMDRLRRAFPQLRFTCSIHGDTRWLDVPVELDCLDVHFYADADPRWVARTRFDHFMGDGMFQRDDWFAEFGRRSNDAHQAIAPMLRARQRAKLFAFAGWARQRGMPLTTTESWSTWYYFDHADLDWSWLLEWAEWSVQDAIDAGMWGWTPHNYLQPQFQQWYDLDWHRRLTRTFLRS